MLNKQAKKSRQSPLQKAASYAENAARLAGAVKSIYDTGKMIYGAARAVAPYAQAAVAML